MIVYGVVGRGEGLAGHWFRDPVFARLLGASIHPASINLFVPGKHDHLFPYDQIPLRPDEVHRRGYLMYRGCSLAGHPAFILRTESPGKAYSSPGRQCATPIAQPNTMFEIVARARLPEVKYGARLQLAIMPDSSAYKRVTL
jgi:hypothetical protein